VSALERPSEVVLFASFDAAGRAEAAARALLHGGLDAHHVALLARDTWGTAFPAVPHSVVLRLPGLGRLLTRGALALELGAGTEDASGCDRLGAALRRLGSSIAEVPRLARALRANRILVLAAVSSREAFLWGRLLHSAGAVFLRPAPASAPGRRTRRVPPAVGRDTTPSEGGRHPDVRAGLAWRGPA